MQKHDRITMSDSNFWKLTLFFIQLLHICKRPGVCLLEYADLCEIL